MISRTRAWLGRTWLLLAIYCGLAALYAWQASERRTPTIFTDEIEFTQMSRAVAEGGRATLRGGEPTTGESLYAYVAAPLWWFDDVATAYGAIKLLGVLLMTAALFPAYALARTVVARPYALFAAAGTAAAPALVYAPFLVDEPLAYPVSTLALLTIARAAATPTRRWVLGALAVCAVGVLVRTQLAILFVVLLAAVAANAWRGDRMRRWRSTWTRGDWVGAATLALGAAVLAAAVGGRYSSSWYLATAFFKGRMFDFSVDAFGALALGVGVLPLVAAVASVWIARRGESDALRAFGVVAVAAFVAFGLYTAIKATVISTTLANVIAERNLIYLTPLLFVGTAIVLERRGAPLAGVAVGTGVATYVVSQMPLSLDAYPNYEAHGLAIAALANRVPRWPADTIETAVVLLAVACGLALAALRLLQPSRVARAAVATVAVFALSWSLTTEIYAAAGERDFSDRQYATLPKPPAWIDAVTRGEPTVYVSQGVGDANPLWQLEFWNRSVRWFWGIDGTAPGPGERRTPNLLRPDGTQDPADLGAAYAVGANGVAINAEPVTEVGGATLYRLDGPVRLERATSGIQPDGWMGRSASFTLYDVEPGRAGFVTVALSREGACFKGLKPARVTARVGPVVVDASDQPALRDVTARGSTEVPACLGGTIFLRTPPQPWRVEVELDGTFVPNELDPNLGDRRELGATVSFRTGS